MNIKNKGTLISIIILLVIFIPCTIIGMKEHFKEVNEDHLPYYDGSLYFYDKNDSLIGTYKCILSDCQISNVHIIDTDEDQDGNVINNTYVFIKDENEIKLYSIKDKLVLNSYDQISTYSNLLSKNIYFITKDSLNGIITTIPTIEPYVEPIYQSLELFKDVNGEYNLDTILAQSDKLYILQKEEDKMVSKYETTNQIQYAAEKFLITFDDFSNIKIYDYSNNDLIPNKIINSYEIIKNYIFIRTANELLVYKINQTEENQDDENYYPLKIYQTYSKDVTYQASDTEIILTLNEETVDTIPFSLEN